MQEDGLPCEPYDTLGRRFRDYFTSHMPRTLNLLEPLSVLPKICEDRVHFVIGLSGMCSLGFYPVAHNG